MPSTCIPGEASWEDAISANRGIIREFEEEAVRFVRKTADTCNLPIIVSYSGGKDSLATLLVVRKALGTIPLLFIDTGLEFPETCRNVEDVARAYGLELVTVSGEGRFRDLFEKFGPPAVNYRWCCGAVKLVPVRELIRDRWESASRSSGSGAMNRCGGERATGHSGIKRSETSSPQPPFMPGARCMSGSTSSGNGPRTTRSMPAGWTGSAVLCARQATLQSLRR
jgi:hypothetical protein